MIECVTLDRTSDFERSLLYRYPTTMKNTIGLLSTLLPAVFVLFCGQAQAQTSDDDVLLIRLQEKYRQIDALEATFRQTTTMPYDDSPQTSTGSIVLSANSYRVETNSQTFVTDGETTWIFTPANEQVLVNDYVRDESSFSLNDFLFETGEHYDVQATGTTTMEGDEYYTLRLAPRDDGTFIEHIVVWMRAGDALITRIEVTDVNDVHMRYDLTNITLNPALPSGIFTFSAPEGIEVIDLRS